MAARVRVDAAGPNGFIDLFVIPDNMVATADLTTPTVSCPMTGASNAVLNCKQHLLNHYTVNLRKSE